MAEEVSPEVRNDQPYFSIDFGTTYSSMAWYDPEKGEAKIIRNDHDEEKTPSLVFFGEDDEVLIGKDALNKIEEFESSDDPREREYVSQRLVRSIKRYLLNPPLIPIPGRADMRPVEVVALILGKLKQDAQENHFREELDRVVLTCPAVYGKQQRNVLGEAAKLAGFQKVELYEEPTAAALTVHNQGLRIGKGVLIYDLGAGTFDLSVVVREEDGTFDVPLEPQGNPRCGGDDFDYALYRYCDKVAQEELGLPPISLTGDVDPLFLKQCRARKENLSRARKSRFGSYLPSKTGPQWFRHEVDRETFEGLIRGRVEGTVKQTAKLLKQAESQGHKVETVVLIGGSSQVPLVGRMLEEDLPVKPSNFAGKTHAVALGAAYHAYELWKPAPKPSGVEAPDRRYGELSYTEEHLWMRREGDIATVGITDYAQDELGDVVDVDLPEEGDCFDAGEYISDIESEEDEFELYAPVGGEVIEVNESLYDSPEQVNEDPYGDGWMIKLRISEEGDLLSAQEYEEFCEMLGEEEDSEVEDREESSHQSQPVPRTQEKATSGQEGGGETIVAIGNAVGSFIGGALSAAAAVAEAEERARRRRRWIWGIVIFLVILFLISQCAG